MDRAALKLVDASRPEAAPRPRRGPALAVAACVLGSAAAATLVGTDGARHPIEPRDTARRALQLSLAQGNDDPEVREMLLELRSSLGRRPLDARARIVYAALLLNMGQRLSDSTAAAHHAARAADLAPVTVPIVRLAVLTLARTGDAALALSKTREMFDYDARSAAGLLAEVEPLVEPSLLEDGLADDPDAWFAWAGRLRTAGRMDQAYDWNVRAASRWPQHLPTLRFVAARFVREGDWEALEQLLPASRDLGGSPAAAPLLIYRSHLATARGNATGAIEDIRRALALDSSSNLIQILAGDAFDALGDYNLARRHWNRALFDVPTDEAATRRNVLARLARLEDRHGRPSTALRLWESVLELEPTHDEARRRVRALSLFDR